ncbi:uncharacterized protein LOC133496874 [Syngnathoides biaculeatus]|uniref:uncharacterized protein LOC133496874 n=1 Tax=Syngnathoides biaculeatus TaxID=300417 RepID=UPI002ADD69AF|nr:uncharacterized protein LOC133496874 [Syngnathoides biaculeatus]XP_061668920.1 uncharacterized protein LOC133496874 [Syngnathoides biaculeatus]
MRARQASSSGYHRGTSWTAIAEEDFTIGEVGDDGDLRWGYVVTVIQTHLTPILDTCTHLAQAVVETKIYWTIHFPPIPICNRIKRAWYDTLLGGTGTVLGLANTADNEVTRTMLSNTGEHSARALHQIGVWLPKALVGQKENAKLWKTVFNWDIKLWDEAEKVLQNLTEQSSWTVCSIQTLHAAAQKQSFLRIVTSGNYQEWRMVWNISDSLWLTLHPEHTKCNKNKCTGYWTQYNVTTTKVVCKYQVLPVITTSGYWFLHMDGEWFEPKTNKTFKSDLCDLTDQGLACRLQHAYSNPCLTDSEVVLCDWTREPAREMMWQVGPHTLCVATTQNNSQVPSVLFVGCLQDVHIWRWGNMTYRLTNYSESRRLTAVQWEVLRSPWSMSLERFKCALESSTDIQKLIKSHASNISSLMVSTMVVKGEVVHAAKLVSSLVGHLHRNVLHCAYYFLATLDRVNDCYLCAYAMQYGNLLLCATHPAWVEKEIYNRL